MGYAPTAHPCPICKAWPQVSKTIEEIGLVSVSCETIHLPGTELAFRCPAHAQSIEQWNHMYIASICPPNPHRQRRGFTGGV